MYKLYFIYLSVKFDFCNSHLIEKITEPLWVSEEKDRETVVHCRPTS